MRGCIVKVWPFLFLDVPDGDLRRIYAMRIRTSRTSNFMGKEYVDVRLGSLTIAMDAGETRTWRNRRDGMTL